MIYMDMISTPNANPTLFIPGWNIKADIFKPYIKTGDLLFTPPKATAENTYDTAVANLDQKIVDPVNIVGWSMGGQLALIFAAKYPQKVAALTLLSSAAVFNRNAAERTSFMNLCRSDFPRAIKYFHKLMGKLSIEQSLLLKENFINDQDSALKYLEELHTQNLTKTAKQIKCPVTIVHSSGDQIIPVQEAYYLKDCLPQACLEILTSDQHFPLFSAYDKMPQLL